MPEHGERRESPPVDQQRVARASVRAAWILNRYMVRHPESTLSRAHQAGKLSPDEAFGIMKELGKDPKTELQRADLLPDMVEYEMNEAVRTGEPLSAAVLDIDDFKNINTELSHLGADDVLFEVAAITKEISGIMQQVVRDDDYAEVLEEDKEHSFRWGGEEFVVLFPGATAEQAAYASRRILDRVTEGLNGRRPNEQLVTLSAGVVQFDPAKHLDPDGQPAWKALLQQADTELLQAKLHPGKNAVYPFDKPQAA